MRIPELELNIDEIILNGIPADHWDRIDVSFREALAAWISENDFTESTPPPITQMDTLSVHARPGESPESIGQQIANAAVRQIQSSGASRSSDSIANGGAL